MSLVKVKIGDLGKVITGNTPPKKDPSNYDGTYPFIKPTDMDIDKRYVTEWDENYSEKSYKQYHRSYIPPGATGVVTIGTVGEKLFQAHQHCFTNQSVNVIISNDKYYDDYVFYLMKLNLPKVESANPGTASGRHHVSKSNFCSIKVDVIESIDSQKRIADILSAYDDLIENNLKRIKLLEQAAQNIYTEWFVNLRFPGHENTPINQETGLPVGWKIGVISDFGKVVTGKTPSTKRSDFYGGHIPFIKTPDMHGLPYVIETSNNLTELGQQAQLNKNLPANSILVSCIGTAGVVAMTSKISQTNQQINSVVFESTFKSYYFYCFAKTLKPLLEGLGSNGATMVNVNKGKFENVDLNIPNESLLVKYAKIAEPMFKQMLTLSVQNQKLKAARDILLPRLMNRTIEV